MTAPPSYHLFERYGVELEYMIVDAQTLDVKPIADEVLKAAAGQYTNEVDRGVVTWSNELVLHVIELKSTGPLDSIGGVYREYQDNVRAIDALLAPIGARLMPGAMHPWMDPFAHTRLWPHDNNEIYDAFNAVFDCRGHGWSNLQSVHLNLPFANDEEFARLHAAVRFLMPIMPALAASSPIVELRATGLLDNRMDVYRTNCKRIPSVTGLVVPEPVFSPDEYRSAILQQMYREIAPFDPEGVLQDEWLNARGAIARFDRNTIEVRVLDVQECPAADLAVVSAISGVLRALCEERWIGLEDQKRWPTGALHDILVDAIRSGERAPIVHPDYARAFGVGTDATAGGLWRKLVDDTVAYRADVVPEVDSALETVLDRGTLATRILGAMGGPVTRERAAPVYARLCDCLAQGAMFVP
ncbi:MAG: glutamate--cysteine ligase [Candidatus Hydrogenedentes bacterium]|nr:glutamate--cysteine ligase [Candidatus Hydrogenedentota bacterium]